MVVTRSALTALPLAGLLPAAGPPAAQVPRTLAIASHDSLRVAARPRPPQNGRR